MFNSLSKLIKTTNIFQSAGGGIFSPNPGLTIWTWMVFFILLLILYRFAWKPILKSLDERENKIRKSIDNAARIEKEVEEISKKNEEILSQAKVEAQQIIEDSRQQGERVKERIKKHAEREAHELMEKAKLSINETTRDALQTIRKEAVGLSIEIASKLINENLDDEKNKKLSSEFLDKLK